MPPKRQQGDRTPQAKKERLTTLAGAYIATDGRIKDITKEKESYKKEIKELIVDEDIFVQNGKHKEIQLPAGDGRTEILVQLQVAESVSTVDNVIALMREKLGEKAEMFIRSVEMPHDNAIETMYNQGLITEQDVMDWTSTKETERLIVKKIEPKK